jgi:hypothetical protein
MNLLSDFIEFIFSKNGINDKSQLSQLSVSRFNLIQDRSVYYCSEFAVRFSSAKTLNFSNTVLSLSNLKKYDHIPFIVCVVTSRENHLLLANSTFLRKISHSSQELRTDNIRGSFNGSDIMKNFQGIDNKPDNFDRLFAIHEPMGFDENLVRLVEATNGISPRGTRFSISDSMKSTILTAPERANIFIHSSEANILKNELDSKVNKFKNEILLASLIENVNVRGRIIEYLIAGEDDILQREIIQALKTKSGGLPEFKTANKLGDYHREFSEYITQTDVKTKIMILKSNPKAYNIDKILDFLSQDRSVFLFYFIGVDTTKITDTILVSMFQENLLNATITLKHWAGRNSRGVTQFEGKAIEDLILLKPKPTINLQNSHSFLNHLMEL